MTIPYHVRVQQEERWRVVDQHIAANPKAREAATRLLGMGDEEYRQKVYQAMFPNPLVWTGSSTISFREIAAQAQMEGRIETRHGLFRSQDMRDAFLVAGMFSTLPTHIYMSQDTFHEMRVLLRQAKKRHGQIVQKERAIWRRKHREEKKARAALARQYRAKR